ncbi:hypothetical protein LIG30_2668 [Burkholderia sp. lig30]|nr:hypothetical protein LIG30_2668 [Burkholderia sp. lig30]
MPVYLNIVPARRAGEENLIAAEGYFSNVLEPISFFLNPLSQS